MRKEEKDRKRKEERKRERKINKELERKLYPGYSTSFVSCLGNGGEDGDDEEEEYLKELLKPGEHNFPAVSSSNSLSETPSSIKTSALSGAAESEASSFIPIDAAEGLTATGLPFTSFSDVLMTTCASPPSHSGAVWPQLGGGTSCGGRNVKTYAQVKKCIFLIRSC